MKLRIFRNIVPVAVAALMSVGFSSCSDELEQSIQDPQTNTTLDATGLLAKIYGSLHLTGTTGGAGNADMQQFDEGNSGFYRRVFEANELCSDECIWTWQGDAGIPELTNISWNSSHGYNTLTYYRIMYNITLCNFYLDETEGSSDSEVLQYRAEVRFMRAYFYSQFVDLYGKAPFKEHYNTDLPVEKSRSEVFAYIVSELKAINGEDSDSKEQLLDTANDDENYGRASKAAANLLLARLYLNAEVYTGTAQWALAKSYAEKVINSGYALCTSEKGGYSAYAQLFMGDNGENSNARQEIIFPIRCDVNSRSYAGSLYPIASATGDGTPDVGLSGAQWTCNRAREAMLLKFFGSLDEVPITESVDDVIAAAGDDRAMFFTGGGRAVTTDEKTTFKSGAGLLKWSNLRTDGTYPDNNAWPTTDVPLFRVAEAYMILAEADFRLGDANGARTYINVLRSRANATAKASVTEQDILDEWSREFYFEGRRRSDLVRFGLFTSGNYVWDWKGGTYAGTGVSSIYNIYPIPADELTSNANMTQNPGY